MDNTAEQLRECRDLRSDLLKVIGGYLEQYYPDNPIHYDDFADYVMLRIAGAIATSSDSGAYGIPVPVTIDRTHANRAYVTLGFADSSFCTDFIKAAERGFKSSLASRKVAVHDGYVLVPTSELDNLMKDWRTCQVSGNQALINVGAKKGMEWAADDLQEIVSNAKREAMLTSQDEVK